MGVGGVLPGRGNCMDKDPVAGGGVVSSKN